MVCFDLLGKSSVCFNIGSKNRNKLKFFVFGFTKHPETNAQQILLRFVSVRTELYFSLFRGHPNWDMSKLQRPVMLLEVSTPQGPELHLELSTIQRPVLHLDMSTPSGLSCTWTWLDIRRLCCSWRCLHYRVVSHTWSYLDCSSLCCSWTCLHYRGLCFKNNFLTIE
jgi:hypothetical protein